MSEPTRPSSPERRDPGWKPADPGLPGVTSAAPALGENATGRGEIADKRRQPRGVLPRHIQTWVLLGLTAVIVGVLLLSAPAPQRNGAPAINPALAAVDPNAARIQDYMRRLDEQARRLESEKAQIELTKRELGLRSDAAPHDTSHGTPRDARDERERSSGDAATERDPLKHELRLRGVRSRFADPLVLSTRPQASQNSQSSQFLQSQFSQPLQSSQNSRSADHTSTVPPRIAAGNGQASAEREPLNRATRAAGATPAEPQPEYRLPEGTVIEAVLTNRLDGGFAGPVNALVTTDVYSSDGQHLLVPAGSRVLGEARPVTTLDQKRLAVSFHRLLLPDGRAVSLDKFQGLNQLGDVGLRDQVNHHYLQVFGASLAVGALGGFAQANTRYGYGVDASAADAYRQGAASSFGQSAVHILDRYLNRLPTITIREGHRLRIYLSNDLMLPAYATPPASTPTLGSTSETSPS